MTEAVQEASAQEAQDAQDARRTLKWAYVFYGLALALPLVVGAAGGIDAFDSGRTVGQMIMSLFIGLIVLEVALRRKAKLIQAYGRFVLGSVMVVWSSWTSFNAWADAQKMERAKQETLAALTKGFNAYDKGEAKPPAPVAPAPAGASEADKGVAFMKLAQAESAKLMADFSAIDRQIAALDMESVLAAHRLVSAQGIAESRRTIQQYRRLVSDRYTTLQRYMDRMPAFFRNADISEANKQSALASFEAGKPKTMMAFGNLASAQEGSARAVMAVIDFAEENLGQAIAQNRQLLFRAQPQLDRYRQLMAYVQAAGEREQAVTNEMLTMQEQSRQSLTKSLSK